MHVQGSQADGFHVQIDGMPIYNQNHLFGLLDASNDEALRTVRWFTGVALARYCAPPAARSRLSALLLASCIVVGGKSGFNHARDAVVPPH